jgi:hypothetical protein
MKSLKSFSFLFCTIASVFLVEPSFGKETWLNCIEKTDWEGKPIKNTVSNLVKLDDSKERFELPYQGVLGKATFFEASINFQFVIDNFAYEWKIDRTNLNFYYTMKLVGGLTPPSLTSGVCKVIPAPSSKKKLI